MKSLCIICVLYSKPPELTVTINSLVPFLDKIKAEVALALWDNSVNGFNVEVIEAKSVHYFHTGQNISLAIAYNKIISTIDSDYYWILDDDSLIDESFIEAINTAIASDVNVACPKIFFHNTMISPGHLKGVRGKLIESSLLEVNYEHYGLISMMSGTLINRQITALIKFNERLNLYGVDTDFYLNCSKLNVPIYLLDHVLIHSSALREITDTEKHIARLENLFSSKWIIFESYKFAKIRLLSYTMLSIIKLIIRKKDCRYFKLVKVILKKTFKD